MSIGTFEYLPELLTTIKIALQHAMSIVCSHVAIN